MNIGKYKFFYESNGFVILRNIVSKKIINKILNEIETIKIKVERIGNKKYFHKTTDGNFNSIHNVQKYIKKGEIFKLSKNLKLKKIVNNIIKKKTKIRNIEFFLKPAKHGLASPYHQDNYYWNILNAEALNVWIACSDANKKNGGVCYLKKSHELGTIKHQVSYAKGSSQKISNNLLTSKVFNVSTEYFRRQWTKFDFNKIVGH